MDVEFSVIIPCYNSKPFIDKAIHSLENQTYNHFEVVFVDDGSTDGTYEYLFALSNHFSFQSTIVQNSHNSGPGVSKGRGVNLARGRYITFMDSDDWFESNYFENLSNVINKTDADIVLFNAFRTFNNGNKSVINNARTFSHCKTIEDYVAVTKGCLPYICSRKNLWHNLNLPPIYNAEDIAVIPILITRANRINVLNKELYNYLYRPHSLSNRVNLSVYKSFIVSFKYTESQMNPRYFDAIEFHGVKTILYGAVFNALRAKENICNIKVFVDDFEKKYPNWFNNKYINSLPFTKRAFLWLCNKHLYFLLKSYVYFHYFALHYLKL